MVNGLFEAVNGVYAAGDAASFFDPVMGRRRISSHDHCVNSGLYAGEAGCFCCALCAVRCLSKTPPAAAVDREECFQSLFLSLVLGGSTGAFAVRGLRCKRRKYLLANK